MSLLGFGLIVGIGGPMLFGDEKKAADHSK